MRESKSARNSLIIAAVALAVTASLFAFNYIRTKQKIEKIIAAAEKDVEPPTVQTVPNNKDTVIAEKNAPAQSLPPSRGVVEIKEKMFLAQVNDVYLNPDDYLGKTIKLEGIFKEERGYEKSYCFVIRYGPGCCGNDGNAGFEVAWAKEEAPPYPAVDSWVEAAGVLKSYEEDGYSQYLYLDLSSLNVLDKRGAELVLQ